MMISPNCNIKRWAKRFDTFQLYLPRCLWVAGAKRGEWPEAYDEEAKKQLLEFALPKEYEAKLISESWCLTTNSFDKSIAKIKEIEPEILRVVKERADKLANAKAIEELQVKAGIKTNLTKSFGMPGKPKIKKNGKPYQTGRKPDGPKDDNGYYACGNCGKTHKGVCRKPEKGTTATTEQNGTPRQSWGKKAAKQYIHKLVASESKKKRKGKGKRRYSSDSSVSESSSSEDSRSWRSGMSGAEQMHMIASAGLDPNDSDIEFDPEDERKYRKQAKKWSRSKGKRRRR